ncbi:hypothetical protein ASG43_03405 [Aureimonas sp. Leaf454]|nr:hypothetical protein ASG43_03405 [Aureimonas sp. Leaf454]
MTAKQDRFVLEYLVDLNATKAAIRAGYSEATASEQGYQLLQNTSVSAAIVAAQAARAERTEITADRVLRHWWSIATADPNELMQHRRINCRACWPEVEPFDATRAPHPDCVECAGEGHSSVHVVDTRNIKGPARLLYAGVKTTKDGLEIKVRDQDKAMENVARHLGMFVDKLEAKVAHSYSEISDDELDRDIEVLLAKKVN